MEELSVQFPHPGGQKSFRLGKGYTQADNKIIREWNNDETHYRKFMRNRGYYLNNAKDTNPIQADLYFWGEWEGCSFFTKMKTDDSRKMPNGMHEPFHSTKEIGTQNTDPYVFGDAFKYCCCKQNGKMLKLGQGSVILFGSTFPSLKKFYVDTVFVVNDFETSAEVKANSGANYSQIYREETLERTDIYLKSSKNGKSNCMVKTDKDMPNNNKIYRSQTWWDNKEFFSFVPCKINGEDNGFERLYIKLDDPLFHLSKYPSGKSYLKNCELSPRELWQEVVRRAIEQGFQLGIRFDEPSVIK